MTLQLARLVAEADIRHLSLIGLAKNVGKTTTTNVLLETLISQALYQPQELVLTSLGLDGEATDALTGLPKPRYIPEAGLLLATTEELLRQAEQEGGRFERLTQLVARTVLGPVWLVRVLQTGRVIIAGPPQLKDIRHMLQLSRQYHARLGIIDGAINRLGAASPAITDACIVCTGASVASTPELVAQRTSNILAGLQVSQSTRRDLYETLHTQVRLVATSTEGEQVRLYQDTMAPLTEATWIRDCIQEKMSTFLLRGALTEELARILLQQLTQQPIQYNAELLVSDATKIFCHTVVLQRLMAAGLAVRVAHPLRILAITINPYTPEYTCSSQHLLDILLKVLPEDHPPVIDVLSGLVSGVVR